MAELARDLIRTQDQLGPRDTENLVFKLFTAKYPNVYGTVKLNSTNIGHAFILGHAVNGVLGIANGVDGQQITLGEGGLGDTTLSRVVSLNSIFVEGLRDTEYIDTDTTDAVVDTNNYMVTF